ncbi:MAG: hypothetical protein H6R18_1117, partial [Proteobacteria bacterium]|nr:hypothetical protein [Pseudomonadota bacterium]
FKAADGKVYFDVNDFDESILAPVTRDLIRLLASILVARKTLDIDRSESLELCHEFLQTYCQTLAEGKAQAFDRESAKGMVDQLLEKLEGRSQQDFLDSRTVFEGKARRLRLDGKKTLAVDAKQRSEVKAAMAVFANQQAELEPLEMLDVARRIAGTGSLGIERFVILVEDEGSADKNRLLDLKESLPSSLPSTVAQPQWESQAHRIVAVQQRLRASELTLLSPLSLQGRSFVLRELQPSEDRVVLDECKKFSQVEGVIRSLAKVVAAGHLRGSEWRSSAPKADLLAFATRQGWQQTLIEVAQDCASQVKSDWRDFAAAFDEGLMA